jgi:hypothetical protein
LTLLFVTALAISLALAAAPPVIAPAMRTLINVSTS